MGQYVSEVNEDEDVYDLDDTVSLSEIMETPPSDFTLAGIDPLTPVDRFLEMNGNTAFITGVDQ